MSAIIDEINFYNDQRNRRGAPTHATIYRDDGTEQTIELPIKYEVCSVCHGEGKIDLLVDRTESPADLNTEVVTQAAIDVRDQLLQGEVSHD